MCKRIPGGIFVVIILIVLFAPVSASAQEDQPTDDEVNAIAKKLYCPVCENTPLDVCATDACIDWRDEIRMRLAEGWNEEQIIQYFVDQHGAQVLPEPPAEGFNLVVYVLPPLVLLVGAVILVRALQGWRTPVVTEAAELPDKEQDEYMSRMEEELRRRRDA